MFTFLFDCDAKRKVNRKEKHAGYNTAYGSIRPLRGNMSFCLSAKIS